MISKARIKEIRQLHQKKHRILQQQFIIEGPKLLEEAIQHFPELITAIYALDSFSPTIDLKNIPITPIDEKSLRQISTLKHPQQVVACCHFIPPSENSSTFKLALDTIQDPGNFGTLLRLAAWFGVGEVIASTTSVDCYNPKVVQASMGAIFQVPIRYTNLETELKETDLTIYGALLDGEDLYASKRKTKGIILLGNEGNGISPSLLPYIDIALTIPRRGEGESLNVGTAGAIFLSEFTRELSV